MATTAQTVPQAQPGQEAVHDTDVPLPHGPGKFVPAAEGQGDAARQTLSGPHDTPRGPQANLETFTETQWVTMRSDLPAYPF